MVLLELVLSLCAAMRSETKSGNLTQSANGTQHRQNVTFSNGTPKGSIVIGDQRSIKSSDLDADLALLPELQTQTHNEFPRGSGISWKDHVEAQVAWVSSSRVEAPEPQTAAKAEKTRGESTRVVVHGHHDVGLSSSGAFRRR